MSESIRNKATMYALLESGRLGNAFPLWHSWSDVPAGHPGPFGVRLVARPGEGGLPYTTQLSHEAARRVATELSAQHQRPSIIYEASPDDRILWQGDVTRGIWGWHVEYSRAKTHLRAAFRQERVIVDAAQALVLLRDTLTPGSFGDLEELLESYPDHVVELSAYDCCVGQIPARNAIVWEVRAY